MRVILAVLAFTLIPVKEMAQEVPVPIEPDRFYACRGDFLLLPSPDLQAEASAMQHQSYATEGAEILELPRPRINLTPGGGKLAWAAELGPCAPEEPLQVAVSSAGAEVTDRRKRPAAALEWRAQLGLRRINGASGEVTLLLNLATTLRSFRVVRISIGNKRAGSELE
jgi:hypothetical protein